MADPEVSVRPLAPGDLEAVVEIDRRTSAASRRGFFEKRFAAQTEDPEPFVSLGADVEGRLAGFLLARVLSGEFGGTRTVGMLDAISVDPSLQSRGIGRRLMEALEQALREHGAEELRTQVEWNRPGLVDFFARQGFTLAPRLVLERGTEHHEF